MPFCGEQTVDDDRIEGDTGRAVIDVTLLIAKCVAVAALFTAAVWFITSYAFDWVAFR
jgi:hypothetical protein